MKAPAALVADKSCLLQDSAGCSVSCWLLTVLSEEPWADWQQACRRALAMPDSMGAVTASMLQADFRSLPQQSW